MAIDRYLLKQVMKPLLAALACMLLALVLERALHLLDVLSFSEHRFAFTTRLAANLLPHFLGLTLPAAFFLALFMVVSRLGRDSEVDALLASGVSLSRITAPFLVLACGLTLVSLAVFGFVQPYSRYDYRALFHTAESAGWSGLIRGGDFIQAGRDFTLTVDKADTSGRRLEGVFVRRVAPDGTEDVTTARTGALLLGTDNTAILQLQDGVQLHSSPHRPSRALTFHAFALQIPLAAPARLLRPRGGDQRELTLFELMAAARLPHATIPRDVLRAELYARLARSFILPLLPLLAVPLGLTTKRAGSAPGIMLAAVLLFLFQFALQLGQSFAATGALPAELAVGGPFAAFAVLCLAIFVSGRKRPGETPVGVFSERIGAVLRRLQPSRGKGSAPA